ncbi:MAG: HAD family hydrolase [Candidatus Electrothrix sp. LOE2]|nr:HAD family hydrolase [Candidatus Electrothrix sp. LOE2]
MTQQPAVFLDRDGTINEQMGYINHISRFILLPGAAQAIRTLNEQHIPVVVVTNQSGLARGYFPPSLLDEVHARMKRELAAAGAHIDGIYICPHHPEAREEQFRKDCTCRKPKTGLLEQAAAELDLDLQRSFMVGDRWSVSRSS